MSGARPPAPPDLADWLFEVARFPLRPWLWPLIVAAALISAGISISLPFLPPVPSGLLALGTMISLWILALRVASRILLATASGAGLEREYRDFDLAEFQALRQIGLWLFVALVVSALGQSLGTSGLALGALLAVALLPAMTCIVATENELGALARRDSWQALRERFSLANYRRLSLLLLALVLLYLLIDAAVGAVFHTAVANGAMMAVWVYALWVWFFALGEQLAATRSTDTSKQSSSDVESTEQLCSRLDQTGGTLEDHRRLIRALEQQGDHEQLLKHGPGHVSALLLAHDRVSEAVEHAAALVALDANFALDIPSSQLTLIKAARDYGHPALVLDLVAAYLRAWPAAPGGREARLIGCEVAAQAPDDRSRRWFAELIRDEVDEENRARLRAIASAYV